MKRMWCWRCQMEMPMLDDGEWARLQPLMMESVASIKKYRARHAASTEQALPHAEKIPALDLYCDLTGFRETNINALWHHQISLYGDPCERCGKPLRTPVARFCAECVGENRFRMIFDKRN